MTVSSEQARIARVRARFASRDPRVLLGIGDDAAVLAPQRESLVWTVDAAVEGVHFRRDLMTLRDAGYRATMAAASDLAAMGATPIALLAGLELPPSFEDAELDALLDGQAEAAAAVGAPIAGGNFASSGEGGRLSITTTALGHAATPLLRSGARPGDAVAVAGSLGFAALGLAAASRGAAGPHLELALDAFRRPTARIAAGLSARAFAHAAIDVSDGLALDASRVADASGVTIEIESNAMVTDQQLTLAAQSLGLDPLELALFGGEDYALVVTLPADTQPPSDFRRIGRVVERGESAIVLIGKLGERSAVAPRGFDHFSR